MPFRKTPLIVTHSNQSKLFYFIQIDFSLSPSPLTPSLPSLLSLFCKIKFLETTISNPSVKTLMCYGNYVQCTNVQETNGTYVVSKLSSKLQNAVHFLCMQRPFENRHSWSRIPIGPFTFYFLFFRLILSPPSLSLSLPFLVSQNQVEEDGRGESLKMGREE